MITDLTLGLWFIGFRANDNFEALLNAAMQVDRTSNVETGIIKATII